MKIVVTVLKYLGLVVLATLIVGVFLPAHSTASRSVAIEAPPATVYAILSSLKRFNEYSPWYAYDPQARYTWSGPDQGVGARMSWSSEHPRVGNGTQEILAVEPLRSVTTRLEFDAPGRAQARWLLAPVAGGGTRVTWTLEQDAGWNVIARWFGVFLDRMIGPDFESGLQRLKAVAEADAAQPGVQP